MLLAKRGPAPGWALFSIQKSSIICPGSVIQSTELLLYGEKNVSHCGSGDGLIAALQLLDVELNESTQFQFQTPPFSLGTPTSCVPTRQKLELVE